MTLDNIFPKSVLSWESISVTCSIITSHVNTSGIWNLQQPNFAAGWSVRSCTAWFTWTLLNSQDLSHSSKPLQREVLKILQRNNSTNLDLIVLPFFKSKTQGEDRRYTALGLLSQHRKGYRWLSCFHQKKHIMKVWDREQKSYWQKCMYLRKVSDSFKALHFGLISYNTDNLKKLSPLQKSKFSFNWKVKVLFEYIIQKRAAKHRITKVSGTQQH